MTQVERLKRTYRAVCDLYHELSDKDDMVTSLAIAQVTGATVSEIEEDLDQLVALGLIEEGEPITAPAV